MRSLIDHLHLRRVHADTVDGDPSEHVVDLAVNMSTSALHVHFSAVAGMFGEPPRRDTDRMRADAMEGGASL